MKNKRIVAFILSFSIMVSMCIFPVKSCRASEVTADFSSMVLEDNISDHYIMGNGMRNSPNRSWLYVNDENNLVLVQYVSRKKALTVAEFDSELNFLNVRSVPLNNIKKWGAFYAGANYNFVVYATDNAVMQIDRYSKDWAEVVSQSYTLNNTKSFISNDIDVAEGNGSLFIVSNHTMSSGHQANMRVQVNCETLSLQYEHTGTATYNGYVSHSYMPEVVYANGTVYTFDRCDSFPGSGLYMCKFNGSLGSGVSMNNVKSMKFNDWGSLNNAIKAGNGVIGAYNYVPASSSNTATDVYLYHCTNSSYTGGEHIRVSTLGDAGTPYVAAIYDNVGYVMWNTDAYSSTPDDDLYIASYTLNSDLLSVGPARKVEGHYLSDCEPVSYNGSLVWFTYDSRDLVFHEISVSGKVTKTVAEPATEPTEATTQPTETTEPTESTEPTEVPTEVPTEGEEPTEPMEEPTEAETIPTDSAPSEEDTDDKDYTITALDKVTMDGSLYARAVVVKNTDRADKDIVVIAEYKNDTLVGLFYTDFKPEMDKKITILSRIEAEDVKLKAFVLDSFKNMKTLCNVKER